MSPAPGAPAVAPVPLALLDELLDVPPDLESRPEADEHERTIDERFRAFHAANPDVYRQLREMALDLVRLGHQKGSMKMLFEVLRWKRALVTVDPDAAPFKLNNIYTSRYARLLMLRERDLDGFFDLRELKS